MTRNGHNMRIDLHGYYVHDAWKHFNQKITEAYFAGHRKCYVITGQGQMMREIPMWCQGHSRVTECVQNKFNPGSFTIKLKKSAKKG